MQKGVSGMKRKASQMSGLSFGSALSRGSNDSGASADSKVYSHGKCNCLAGLMSPSAEMQGHARTDLTLPLFLDNSSLQCQKIWVGWQTLLTYIMMV